MKRILYGTSVGLLGTGMLSALTAGLSLPFVFLGWIDQATLALLALAIFCLCLGAIVTSLNYEVHKAVMRDVFGQKP